MQDNGTGGTTNTNDTAALDTAHFDIPRPTLKPRLFGPVVIEHGEGDREALRATAEIASGAVGDTWSSRVYRQLLRDRQPAAARADVSGVG